MHTNQHKTYSQLIYFFTSQIKAGLAAAAKRTSSNRKTGTSRIKAGTSKVSASQDEGAGFSFPNPFASSDKEEGTGFSLPNPFAAPPPVVVKAKKAGFKNPFSKNE